MDAKHLGHYSDLYVSQASDPCVPESLSTCSDSHKDRVSGECANNLVQQYSIPTCLVQYPKGTNGQALAL